MTLNEIENEINFFYVLSKEYSDKINSLSLELEHKKDNIQYFKTPVDILNDYMDKKKTSSLLTNKSRHKMMREICNIEEEYKFIKEDTEKYGLILDLEVQLKTLNQEKADTLCYMRNNVENIVNILNTHNFIEKNINENKWEIQVKGIIASNIQECHPLALSELYMYTNGFDACSASEIASIFSCFTNISVNDDNKVHKPTSSIHSLVSMGTYLIHMYETYYDAEINSNVNTGSDYNLHFQIMNEVYQWCNAKDESDCILIINDIKQKHNIFLGEFVKAVLKINNICNEFEKICETLGNIKLLSKIKEIPKLTLKYVVTNLSLYV
jgi:hypothetical protein